MKIVNIIQRYPPAVGGSEIWCQQVSQYLAQRGHQVRVLTLDVNKEEEFWREPTPDQHTLALGPLAFDGGVTVRRYRRSLPIHTIHHQVFGRLLDERLNFHFYGPHSSEMYGRMWREIRWADVVFLHTQPYPHNYIAFLLAKWLRKRIVIVPHFHPSHPHYERGSNYWLLGHSDVVVADTEYEKEYLIGKGVPAGKIVVIGIPIHPQEYIPDDLEAFREQMARQHGLTPDDLLVTFIGRKMPEKGVGYLVEAVRALMPELPLKLLLVGPTFDWFQKLYAGLSTEERTRIIDLGVLPHQDKVNLLHLSHLLALPSRYEAFGIVFLEAWTCAVPVLGARGGAVPSVIGEEGYLCDFGDVQGLTDTLRHAFSDPTRMRALGEKGRAKVLQNYTWETIGRKAERAIRMAHANGKTGNRLKIIIATNSYPPRFMGGAELIAHAQARLLQERGHEVMIFAGELDDDGERHSVRLDHYDGLPVVRVCLHSRDYSSEFFGFYHERVHREFEALLDRVAPDVVHFHNINGLSVSLVEAARRRKVKTVLTLHDYWGICFKNTLLKQADEVCVDHTRCHECMPTISGKRWREIPIQMRQDYIALHLASVDAFISPSEYLARTYGAGLERHKMHVIANGVDLDRFARIRRRPGRGPLRFTFVGHLGHHKGLDTVLEAVQYLEADKRSFFLNLAGEGERRGHYEDQLRSLGLSNRVRFWGKVDPRLIQQVYRETDVLLLPSIWPENQPVSITEAMAAGIPVIASRLGGIPELVDEGRTGYLFQPGNARDLASNMAAFIDDPSKLALLGANARRAISALGMGNQIDKILKVYEQETPSHTTSSQNLILCAGKTMSPECAFALDRFRKASRVNWRFCLQDWLGEDWIGRARLLWVVDPTAGTADLVPALRNHVPLLVPEENRELRDLCVHGQCGLYYAGREDAVECLRFLTEEEETRQIFGQNGFRLFYRESARTLGGVA